MDFSVVIPVKNRGPLLRRALESLKRQTFRNFETIVIDDGSTEDIGAVVAAYGDLAIRLLRTGGRGAPFARNTGTDAATAAYVAYLDSDDVFLPEKLERMAQAIADGVQIVAGPGYVWRGEPRVQLRPSRAPRPDEDISEFFFVADQRIQTSSLVVRTDAARQILWDERLHKAQDPDVLIRLMRAGYRMKYIPEPLVVFYDDTPNDRISHTSSEANLREWLARSGEILTAKARTGFELYVLAHEVSLRSRPAALAMVLSRAFSGAVAPRVVAKSLYRSVVPQALFKRTAQFMLRGNAGSLKPELAAYLAELSAAVRLR